MRKICLLGSALLLLATALSEADETTNLSCGVRVDFSTQPSVGLGSSVLWRVSLSNASSATWTSLVSLHVDAVGYNGEKWGDVVSKLATNVLTAGSTDTVEVVVTPGDYAAWPRASLCVVAGVEVVETNDIWLTSTRSDITTPTNILFLSPQPPLNIGAAVTAQVSCLNPLPVPLYDVKVYVTTDEPLSTNNTLGEHEFSLGTVGTNESIVVSTNFIAGATGTGHVWAMITASNLTDISASQDVPITE